MPRLYRQFRNGRAIVVVALVSGLALAMMPYATRAAGNVKQLQHVRGDIGYQTAETGTDYKAVFGKFDLPDDDFAATHAQSAAVIALPDSSLVSLGENTTVKASAFDTTAAGPGSTIQVAGGSLRFDIRRPQGGTANYRFVTNTSAVGVRGTVGLLSFVNGVTTVGCLACAADSVTVTAGGQTVSLVTGQFIAVSASGAITTGALSAVLGTFTAAGVPISAEVGAAAAGLPAGGIAGVSSGTAITAGAAAAVVGGTVAGVTSSSNSKSGNVTTPLNSPTPSGGGQAGAIGLDGHAASRTPQATASASPQPAVRVPSATVIPGPGARIGR
jgi:hypothetical protein